MHLNVIPWHFFQWKVLPLPRGYSQRTHRCVKFYSLAWILISRISSSSSSSSSSNRIIFTAQMSVVGLWRSSDKILKFLRIHDDLNRVKVKILLKLKIFLRSPFLLIFFKGFVESSKRHYHHCYIVLLQQLSSNVLLQDIIKIVQKLKGNKSGKDLDINVLCVDVKQFYTSQHSAKINQSIDSFFNAYKPL